jgi:serine/threonine protein kinase
MKCQIFFSYRREDSKEAANWLFEKLREKFGDNVLFMDTGSIEAGDIWNDEIKTKLEETEIVLVIIGKEWLTKDSNEFGMRRIDNDNDWVRKEVETAIKNNKIIIPILLNDAKMPPSAALPDPIKKLESSQAYEIRVNSGANSGIEGLIKALTKTLHQKNTPDELRESLEKVIVDKYEIVEELGSGGKKKVYLAKDKALDRYVTIRTIQDPSLEDEFIDTLKDAAKVVSIIPNCIQIFGAWVEKEPVHVVMSYLEGGTLRTAIDDTDGRGLPLSDAHNLLLALCTAIMKAHDAGITHCNLKPSHIILSVNEEPYISPLCRYRKTNENYILDKFSQRTPDLKDSAYREDLCYLAPEIFNINYSGKSQRDRNEKIDQYMLGLTGYDMLTGRIPNTVSTYNELNSLKAGAFKQLGLITEVRKDCPSKLSEIIHRMISIDPGQRYDKLKDVIIDLEKISFDDVEIAKDSYFRCILNSNLNDNFIKAFYNEFIRISPQAAEKFKVARIGELKTHPQYDMLREAIFILFMFAENKLGDREPNVLTRIADSHSKSKKDISAPLYKDFVKALTNTVCGAPPDGPQAYDNQCNVSESEKYRIKSAWEKALQPGIDYMIGRYWHVSS